MAKRKKRDAGSEPRKVADADLLDSAAAALADDAEPGAAADSPLPAAESGSLHMLAIAAPAADVDPACYTPTFIEARLSRLAGQRLKQIHSGLVAGNAQVAGRKVRELDDALNWLLENALPRFSPEA